MTWIINIIIAILRALVPALIKGSRPTCEEAKRQPELKIQIEKAHQGRWLEKSFTDPDCRACSARLFRLEDMYSTYPQWRASPTSRDHKECKNLDAR